MAKTFLERSKMLAQLKRWATCISCCAMVLLSIGASQNPASAQGFSDEEIIKGFNYTVFGAEISPFGVQANYVRKFRGPVRFFVHDLSNLDRKGRVEDFIISLNGRIANLETTIVNSALKANFNVYVVDREDYLTTARNKVYRRPLKDVPGRCLVRSFFSHFGISRSDAIIVSDEGEQLFNRCLVEEILQGLGPLNEHPSLEKSVFNDESKQVGFTHFDLYILNLLYDTRIKNGATMQQVEPILPIVLQDLRVQLK